MFKRSQLFLVFAIVLGAALFTFQNCSNQQPESSKVSSFAVPNPVNKLTSQITSLQWRYTSGSLPPMYQYDISYRVDFSSKQFTLSVNAGSATSGLPRPKDIILNDTQLSQILSLFDKITYEACAKTAPIVGGGIDELSVFTTSTTTANILIYANICPNGFSGPNGFVNTFGYQNLINYLKSL